MLNICILLSIYAAIHTNMGGIEDQFCIQCNFFQFCSPPFKREQSFSQDRLEKSWKETSAKLFDFILDLWQLLACIRKKTCRSKRICSLARKVDRCCWVLANCGWHPVWVRSPMPTSLLSHDDLRVVQRARSTLHPASVVDRSAQLISITLDHCRVKRMSRNSSYVSIGDGR